MRAFVGLCVAFCFSVGLSQSASAQELNPFQRLRKLSFHLRGVVPEKSDVVELEKILKTRSTQVEPWLQDKAKEYTSSRDFEVKFSRRMAEILRLGRTENQSEAEDSYLQMLTDLAQVKPAALGAADLFPNNPTGNFGFEARKIVTPLMAFLIHQKMSFDDLIFHPVMSMPVEFVAAIREILEKDDLVFRSISNEMTKNKLPVEQALQRVLTTDMVPLRGPLIQSLQALDIPIDEVEINRSLAREILLARLEESEKYTALPAKKKDQIRQEISKFTAPRKNTGIQFSTRLMELTNRTVLFADLYALKNQIRTPHDLFKPEIFRRISSHLTAGYASQIVFPGFMGSTFYSQNYDKTKFSESAAFYRILLCDEMSPVADIGKNIPMELIARRLRANAAQPPPTPEGPHASNSNCQTCHKQLDRIQEIYGGDGKGTTKVFLYKDIDSSLAQINYSSANELLKKVRETRVYRRCQVRRLWNLYLGTDVPLAEAHLSALEQEFSKSPSIQDFSRLLVSRPEFRNSPPLKITSFHQIKPIFDRCLHCHQSSEKSLFDLTKLPFGLSDDPLATGEHFESLKVLSRKIDIFDGGAKATMPPRRAGFKLSRSELSMIVRWMEALAPDENSRPTITESQRAELLGRLAPELKRQYFQDTQGPSFGNFWRRYFEYGEAFARVLSYLKPTSNTFSACQTAVEQVGKINKETGEPIFSKPGPALVNALGNCTIGLADLKSQNLVPFPMFKKLVWDSAEGADLTLIKLSSLEWKSWPKEFRMALLIDILNLLDEPKGLVTPLPTLISRIDARLNALEPKGLNSVIEAAMGEFLLLDAIWTY